MRRRYSLRRSDNAPAVGERAAVVSGSGEIEITTGFPVTSAIISHIASSPTNALSITLPSSGHFSIAAFSMLMLSLRAPISERTWIMAVVMFLS